MRPKWRPRAGLAAAAAGGALLLALLGAVGWGPAGELEARVAVLVDASPSAASISPPASARLFRDSNLTRALEEASVPDPDGRSPDRAVLYTDGCHVGTAAPRASSIRTDVVLLPRADNIRLLRIQVPGTAAPGEDIPIVAEVGRTAGGQEDASAVSVTLRVERGGEAIGSPRTVQLAPGERRRVRFADRVDRPGIVRYEARCSGGPGPDSDDSRIRLVRVGDRPVVLSVGGPDSVPGFHVLTAAPGRVARMLDPLLAPRIDAVWWVAGPMPEADQRALVRLVRGGAGLLVSGGQGVAGQPIEAVLPLTDAPPEGRAALLALDVSGSMRPHLRSLEEAAKRLFEFLGPGDRAAHVAFTSEVVGQSPWTPAREARPDLSGVQAQGNTRISSALAAAAERLRKVAGAQRRLFIVSDGRWPDEDRAREQLRALRSAGVVVNAVFLGSEPSSLARELFPKALRHRPDGDWLNALRELESASRDRKVPGVRELTRVAGPEWVEGALPDRLPEVALERLYPRGVGESLVLQAGDAPAVAVRNVGGRVAMSAGRLDGEGRTPLAQYLPGLLRRTVREQATGHSRLRARRLGRGLVLSATGDSGGDFEVDGTKVPARPVGPRRWAASVARVGGGPVRVGFNGAVAVVPAASDRELDGLRPCAKTARAIALQSGGQLHAYRAGAELPWDGGRSRRLAYWPLLFSAALLLLASARRGMV